MILEICFGQKWPRQTRYQWLKWGGSAPLLRFELPLLLMKKCYFMHKMCQIPHLIDASVP